MNKQYAIICVFLGLLTPATASADPALMKTHCGKCHTGNDAEGKFTLKSLGSIPNRDSLEDWLNSLDRVKAGEMPPEDESELNPAERRNLIAWLRQQLEQFDRTEAKSKPNHRPRRMNNREFAASIADVLMIEDVGTHLPTDNLIADALYHGFDTHSETLGFSKFHLEQYIRSVRKIVDATILPGTRPKQKRYKIPPERILSDVTAQNIKRPDRAGTPDGFDFLDPKQLAYFQDFKYVPTSGRYRVTIRVIGKDRGRYDAEGTGVLDDDPIRLRVEMGDRQYTFDLPDEKVEEIKLEEWLAKGTRLQLQNPTDGLRLVGNGNFKFQNRLTASYFKKYQPKQYAELIKTFTLKKNGQKRNPDDWHNWVDHWMGPRPRVLSAFVEGPFFKTWPPQRHVDLIGRNPAIKDTRKILTPIAERAWRRPVQADELDEIIALVNQVHASRGIVPALKEGIVAVLVSPQFLLLNSEQLSPSQRFASKLSYFLQGTTPSAELRTAAEAGQFASYESVVNEVKRVVNDGNAKSFQVAFPYAWLELNDINFMAPDPEKYHHYHRKLVSHDMINEVLHLFRHATEQNIPVPELLLADYTFVNADLAKVYGLTDVPQDSKFRKYTFNHGQRGGLIGTGAFLTSTADSLFTSPIHRAIYVMENFLGIHATPPPPDVEITEPDVRQAKTIKEILAVHRSDKNCASCHQLIDPFGYAFENYGPDGRWRDVYTVEATVKQSLATPKKQRAKPKLTRISIDASSEFLSGAAYKDIVGFRKIMKNEASRNRMVRCFINKLLTYANGVEPDKADFAEIDRIMEVSAKHDHRIVETIAAVIHSPLFREE
ncbi:MAG: DUF1592 domain-containing protein [Fuerstiella sp.]